VISTSPRYQMRDTNSLYDSNIRKLSVTL